jgi:hypothetical protein
MTSELNAPRVVRTGIIRSRCAPDGISKETDLKPVNVLSSTPRVLRSLSNRKRIFSPSWENACRGSLLTRKIDCIRHPTTQEATRK